MEYIESINIFGKEYKPNSCIILESAPTKSTPALIGMLALDTSSEEKDLYKCVAISGEDYEWRKLSSGSGNTSAKIVENINNVPEGDRNEFTDYYEINGDKYLHYRWNETSRKFIMIGTDAYSKDETYTKGEVNDIKDSLNDTIEDISIKVGEPSDDNEDSLFERVEDLENGLANFKGDNSELKVSYVENGSVLYLHTDADFAENGGELDPEKIISQTVITGSGGSSVVSSLKLTFTKLNGEETIIVPKSEGKIQKDVNIKFKVELTTVEENPQQLKQNISYKIRVNNIEVKQGTLKSGEEQDWNITSLLSTSSSYSNIQVLVYYNEKIEGTSEVIPHQKSGYWSVEAKEMYLSPDDINFDKTLKTVSPVKFYFTAYGSGLDKYIHYKLDGIQTDVETPIKSSGISNFIDLPITAHGAHSFEIWCSAAIGDEVIESEHYYYDIMYAEAGNNTPIIRVVVDPTAKLEQYYRIPFYYSVYSFDKETTDEVTINKDGVIIKKENLGRTEQTDYFTPETAGEKEIVFSCSWNDNGTLKTFTRPAISLNIQPSQNVIPPQVSRGLALDFNPKNRANNSSDYDKFYGLDGTIQENGWELSPNFDWVNGGWRTDEEGRPYFCVKAGTWVKFNYKLFKDENVLIGEDNTKGNGKEFKIIFKTENVANANTEWLNCIANSEYANPTGLQMNAHKGHIKFNGQELAVPYSEEDIVEFDMNIVPITLTNGEIDKTIQDIPMIMTYEDGTPVQPFVIDSKEISLTQMNTKDSPAAPIKIGSAECECDVLIYRMKAYTNFLKDDEVIQNFISDAEGAEKNNRFVRNQIFEEGTENITPESVANACPHLRVVKISAPYFTNDKGNKIPDTEIQMIYGNGDETQNWIAKNCMHSGQGTSSNDYGYSARNLSLVMNEAMIKDKFESSASPEITFGDQTKLIGENVKVQLVKNSVPVDILNIKVNVASSEHANNALLAKRYDRYLPYQMAAEGRYTQVDSNGNKLYDVRNTMDFYNCVVFIQEKDPDISTHREFADCEWHFYSIGNIGDYKDSDIIRASDPDDDNEFCNEIVDWNRPLSNFPSNTYVNVLFKVDKNGKIKFPFKSKAEELISNETTRSEIKELQNGEYIATQDTTLQEGKDYYIDSLKYDDYAGDFTYEFRYIKDNDEALNKAKNVWKNFYAFVVQDVWKRDSAGEIIFEIDETTGLERKQLDEVKAQDWKNKLKEWFISEAALYYYIYTLRYTMVDNRAKNSFWHYGKTGKIRTVSNPVPEMLHVYYEKVDKDIVGAELLKNLDGVESYYKKTEDTSIKDGTIYYTQYAFDFWDYDNDTALGIDNMGKLDMDYGVEDEDRDASNAPYFRAHDSTFFVKLARVFEGGEDGLPLFYSSIDPSAFNADHFINEFDTWQQEFPEQLWKLDYETKYKRTYVGGYGANWDNRRNPKDIDRASEERFLKNMMNGRKKYQRRQFERDQEKYMISKFDNQTMTTDRITLRGSKKNTAAEPPEVLPAPMKKIMISPYAKTYLNLYNDVSSRFEHKRVVPRDEPYEVEYPNDQVDFIYVQNASRISSLGDLSLLYLNEVSIANGRKLKEIKLGNSDSNYDNSSLTTLGIAKENSLLETMDFTNISKITSIPAIEQLPSLRFLRAEGTFLSSVTFANNGLVKEAYLPHTVTQLSLKNLYYLDTITCRATRKKETIIVNGEEKEVITSLDGNEDYHNIISLTIDNCPQLSQEHVMKILQQATQDEVRDEETGQIIQEKGQLKRLYVTNINWTLSDTSLLNKLVNIKGLSGEDSKCTLTGTIHIAGNLKESELIKYREIWGDDSVLQITSDSFTEQVIVYYYKNKTDEEGDYLYFYPADAESTLKDPRIEYGASTPQKEGDEQYKYTFAGWEDLQGNRLTEDDRGIEVGAEDLRVNAFYTTSPQTYSVKWYSNGSLLGEKTGLQYGSETSFESLGISFEKRKISLLPGSENEYKAEIFTGWDRNTGFITKDDTLEDPYQIIVNAQWQIGSTRNAKGKELSELLPADLLALSCANKITESTYDYGDEIEFYLGHDFNFDKVLSNTLVSIDEPKFFFHTNENSYSDPSVKLFDEPIYTGIRPFKENKSFTLVLDHQFTDYTKSGALISCYNEKTKKLQFALRVTNTEGEASLSWDGLATPVKIGYTKKRTCLVIRYNSHTKMLYIYSSHNNSGSYSADTSIDNPMFSYRLIDTIEPFEGEIVLGSISPESNIPSRNGSGIIHWCKIWYDDLGNTNAEKLASYPREKITMELCAKNRYYIEEKVTGSINTTAGLSFISKYKLGDRDLYMNSTVTGEGTIVGTNVGGWPATRGRKLLSQKILNAFPEDWRLALAQVRISSSEGGGSEAIVVSEDYIYLPAYVEISPSVSTTPYTDEGDVYLAFGVESNRDKLWVVPNYMSNPNYKVFKTLNDPMASNAGKPESEQVQLGDFWWKNNSFENFTSECYVFVTNDIIKKYNLTRPSAELDWEEGGWYYPVSWWTRSPDKANSINFMRVYYPGSVGGVNAQNAYNIRFCFSI